jgi:hypothetical protein
MTPGGDNSAGAVPDDRVRTVDRNRELLFYCPEEILAAFGCELRFFAQNAHLSLVLSDKPLS